MIKQGTELTVEQALQRRVELTKEISWIKWATTRDELAVSQTNLVPDSLRGQLLTMLDDRTNELAVLNRHLSSIRITF